MNPLDYTLEQFGAFASDYGLPVPKESSDTYTGRRVYFGTARRGFVIELEGEVTGFRVHDDEFREYQAITSDSPYATFHMLLADTAKRLAAGPKRGHAYTLMADRDGNWYAEDVTIGGVRYGERDALRRWLGWEFDHESKRKGEAKL